MAQQANVSIQNRTDTAHGIATLELVSQPWSGCLALHGYCSEAKDEFLPEVVPVRTVGHSDSLNNQPQPCEVPHKPATKEFKMRYV